jgi:hypothetical protein
MADKEATPPEKSKTDTKKEESRSALIAFELTRKIEP